jgi:hypothetical protein
MQVEAYRVVERPRVELGEPIVQGSAVPRYAPRFVAELLGQKLSVIVGVT